MLNCVRILIEEKLSFGGDFDVMMPGGGGED